MNRNFGNVPTVCNCKHKAVGHLEMNNASLSLPLSFWRSNKRIYVRISTKQLNSCFYPYYHYHHYHQHVLILSLLVCHLLYLNGAYCTHRILRLWQNWWCRLLGKPLIETVRFQNFESTPNTHITNLYLKGGNMTTIFIWQHFLGNLAAKCKWLLLWEGLEKSSF